MAGYSRAELINRQIGKELKPHAVHEFVYTGYKNHVFVVQIAPRQQQIASYKGSTCPPLNTGNRLQQQDAA